MQTTVEQLKAKLLDAETRAGKWLADGNEHNEAGRKVKAEQCYAKSQFWLDRANQIQNKIWEASTFREPKTR